MHGPIDTLMTTADLAGRAPFRIGTVVVDPSTRTVTGPDASVQVEPRVMQVLVVLADAEGAVVTRDTLFARCWGGVFVGDDSLNRAVAGVRRLASGVAANSFEVETVPRTGYRLIGSAVPVDAAAAAPPAEGSPRPVSRRMLLGGLLAVGAGGLALWSSQRGSADAAAPLIEESQVAMRAGTPQGQRRALALLEEAVQKVPNSASAWGLLALTLARADEHAVGLAAGPATKVEQAARRALQLDPDNADGRAALVIALPYYGDWLRAEGRFDALLQHHPEHLYTQDSRAFLLGAVGRLRESARDRLSFSPKDAFQPDFTTREIYAHWFLGQVHEADRVGQRGRELWPRHAGLWFARFWVLTGTGRFDRALAMIDDQASRPELPAPMLATLRNATMAAWGGDAAAREAAVRQIMAGVERSVAAVVNAVMLLNLLGATDAAFMLADAYYLEQGPVLAAMSWRPGQPFVPDQRRRKTNMLFTPTARTMQRDPRFMPLMQEMGLTDYWRRRGVQPDFLLTPSATA